jgi:hypothetical protein
MPLLWLTRTSFPVQIAIMLVHQVQSRLPRRRAGRESHAGGARAREYRSCSRHSQPKTYEHRLLWEFNETDGWYPSASLILDRWGNLYGTTQFGGKSADYHEGTVFKLIPEVRHEHDKARTQTPRWTPSLSTSLRRPCSTKSLLRRSSPTLRSSRPGRTGWIDM